MACEKGFGIFLVNNNEDTTFDILQGNSWILDILDCHQVGGSIIYVYQVSLAYKICNSCISFVRLKFEPSGVVSQRDIYI